MMARSERLEPGLLIRSNGRIIQDCRPAAVTSDPAPYRPVSVNGRQLRWQRSWQQG
jgi:hypothetical protein